MGKSRIMDPNKRVALEGLAFALAALPRFWKTTVTTVLIRTDDSSNVS